MTRIRTEPRPRRAGRPRPAVPSASVTPHDCAILAVDPAETTGWAIWSRGQLIEFGECDLLDGSPQRILDRFKDIETSPWVLAIERPFYVRYANQTSLGAADKVWRDLARRVRLASRTVRVYPASWRARVLGPGWARAPRDKVRAREQEVAALVVLEQHGPSAPLAGADASAAILIGKWATHAGEVQRVLLPKSKRRVA